jgi:predicted enzyme related to lactoylglutathione lyase
VPKIIGIDPATLRGYYGELFGWQFDTSGTVAPSVSRQGNYGFTDTGATGGGAGIPGGIGGGPGYHSHVIFYVGVPDVEAALRRAEASGGSAGWAPSGPRAGISWSATSPTPRAT